MEYNAVDLSILQALHIDLAHPLLQKLMVFISSEVFFALMSLCLITFILRQKRAANWKRLIGLFAAVGATDAISAHFFKPFFGRLRPCQVFAEVESLTGCAGLYSFPSNHASNTMAVATFVFFAIDKKVGHGLMYVALVMGVSRVVIGVHYPSDIVFGYLVGFSIAFCFAKLTSLFSGATPSKL
jgi:undecaprenyl-diphosphatase